MSRKLWVASVVALSLAIVALVADRSRSQEQGEGQPAETSAVATDQVKPTPFPAPEKPRIWATEDPEGTERLCRLLKDQVVATLESPDDATLEKVLNNFSYVYGENFHLDTIALDELGLGADEPIVINVKNVRLGQALRLMLEPLELTYCVDNGMVVITTEEAALNRLPVAVYDVRDLLLDSDFDTLIEPITSTIASDTWAENGGGEAEIRAYPQRGSLVISQSTRVHEEVLNFLTALRVAPFDPEAKPLPTYSGDTPKRGGGACGKEHEPKSEPTPADQQRSEEWSETTGGVDGRGAFSVLDSLNSSPE